MEEKIVKNLNEMSEYLSIAQMKKLQEKFAKFIKQVDKSKFIELSALS
jgi:integrase/recombinase XerD